MSTDPRKRSTPPPIAFFSVFVVGLLATVFWRISWEYAVQVNQREIQRVTSPDHLIDAVLVEPKVELITKQSVLYLVARGEPAPSWDGVLQVTRLSEPPTLAWTHDGMLEFRYNRGCVQKFSNIWHSDDVLDGHKYVELRLTPATEMPCTGGGTVKPLVAQKPSSMPKVSSVPAPGLVRVSVEPHS
jgi:hypothetical protein